ncbi:MAG: OmpA family protein [Flavobacteriales bacterium]|nr:OmpA family protein [Flavobacteriales bacterium]
MRNYFLIFLFLPLISYSQFKDYKNFDKAIKYNKEGNLNKSIKFASKALENSPQWESPKLLIASIYANSKEINKAVSYLLSAYYNDENINLDGIKKITKLYYENGFYEESLKYAKLLILKDSVRFYDSREIRMIIKSSKFSINAINNPVDFSPKNLGSNINSSKEEYLPAISYNGKNLVYSRRLKKNNVFQEDFYVSKLDENSNWILSKPYFGTLNTNGNEGAFSFSSDTGYSVFTACDRFDSMGSCDLYILFNNSTFNAGKIINSKSWESQGCFSPDGRYLYFVSNRSGGYGGKDIWRSQITDNGFLEPENLGPKINTEDDEMSPFLHPDNLTFYFASSGHVGMGGYDVYISKRIDGLNEWSLPTNLGYPINTFNTENSLIVANDGRTAYYTSNQSGFGLEDIFVFNLPENLRANKLSAIELDIISSKKGKEVVLNNVVFASNSSKIDSSSFKQLNDLILYLLKNPDISLEIQGHTDNIGSNNDNLILSTQRAEVVYNYIRDKVSNRLEFKGYGELVPLFSNTSEENRLLNRRTSFIIN